MIDATSARYEEKVSSSGWLAVLVGAVALLGVGVPLGVFLGRGGPRGEDALLLVIPPAIIVLLIAVLVSQFFTLRIRVGGGMLVFGFGLFQRRFPVQALRAFRPTTYRWQTYGGWGIRWGRDGSSAYNVMGDQGMAVRITADLGTKTRDWLFSSRKPHEVCRALEAEIAAAGLSAPRPNP
jgi:hypothetical protein